MKKLLLTSLLTLCASLAYAGSSCGEGCGGDKKDKDGKEELSSSVTTLACKDKCDGDKKGDKADSELFQSETSVACKKDKCDSDKADKEEFRVSAELLA